MRILVFNNLYPPYIVGGNEILAHDVVQALRQRGHTVHVATGRGMLLQGRAQVHPCLNIDLDRLGRRFLGQGQPNTIEKIAWQIFDPRTCAASWRVINQVKPDLIVAWNLGRASAAPLLAARASGRPFLAHVADKWLLSSLYDLGAWWPPYSRRGEVIYRLKARLLQDPLRRLCGRFPIVAISEFMRSYYAQAVGSGWDVRALRLGVDTSLYAPGERRARSRGVRALYAGALWEGKGPHIAIRALGELVWQHGVKNARLDIYGEGAASFKQQLGDLIKHQRLESRVRLHGYAARHEIVQAMQEHDLLVFPSLWDEPFAAVPVEAMSCGLPVVASDSGGTPELVSDGHNGLLVRAGDASALAAAWLRLARDADLRRRLGAAARQTVMTGYSFSAYVDRLESFYQRVAAQ